MYNIPVISTYNFYLHLLHDHLHSILCNDYPLNSINVEPPYNSLFIKVLGHLDSIFLTLLFKYTFSFYLLFFYHFLNWYIPKMIKRRQQPFPDCCLPLFYFHFYSANKDYQIVMYPPDQNVIQQACPHSLIVFLVRFLSF